ncbi:hypothetical protein [Myroides injenensis]|nr:hypothetical protein [Myroides injenensis]
MIDEIKYSLYAFNTVENMIFSTVRQQFFKTPSTNDLLYGAIMGKC